MNMSQFFSILGAGVGGIVVGWVLRSAYGARQTVTRAISSSADRSGAAGAVKAKVNSKEPMKMVRLQPSERDSTFVIYPARRYRMLCVFVGRARKPY